MTLMLQSPAFDLYWRPEQGVLHLESPGRSLSGIFGVEVLRGGRLRRLTTKDVAHVDYATEEACDVHGPVKEVHIRYREMWDLLLSVEIRLYPTRPFVLLRVGVLNKGPDAVKMRHFFFRTLPGALQPSAEPSGFYSNGWQSWSPAGFHPVDEREFGMAWPLRPFIGPMMHNSGSPWPRGKGRFLSESVGALVSKREALVAGGVSLADQFVQVHADLRPGHLALTLQAQGDDVPLVAGEARFSEWFYLEWVPLPNRDPLAQYAYAVARQMHVSPLRPLPGGWSSWYIFWDKVTEAAVMDNLAAAAMLSEELPLEVIQLDQGFESRWGDWTERDVRDFPHTLDWLSARIRGSGFTPGLWLGPFTVHPRSRLATEHPDWLLRNHRGRPVSAGFFSNSFFAWALDPTHPGVKDYLRQLIRTVVERWGYAYLKLDFLYAASLPGRRHNPSLTRAQAYRRALEIIREAAGEATYLVGCGAPLGPSIGLVDAMRIGPDTAPYWVPRVPRLGHLFRRDPSLPSLRNSLRNVASRAWMHGRWWINDPDNLVVRDVETNLDAAEVKAQITLQGLNGGLTVLSDDLTTLDAQRRAWVQTLFPSLLGGMDALDLFRREMPEVVVAPVARPWDNWQLVGLFNWSSEPEERELPRTLPNFDLSRSYHIVDFWNRRYLRREPRDPLPQYRLPSHGAVLLGIRPVKTPPQVVGTTFHISQGGEVAAITKAEDSITLDLRLDRTARGEVWLALPAPPQTVTLDGAPLSKAVRGVAPGVWAVDFTLPRVGTLCVRFG
ncbi:MAG: glycoside hydrolase family 36 protein [Anaerolineae bacterium]